MCTLTIHYSVSGKTWIYPSKGHLPPFWSEVVVKLKTSWQRLINREYRKIGYIKNYDFTALNLWHVYTLTSRSCRGFQGGNVRPTIRGGDSLSFLYSICRRSVPSILPGKWNNQSTNIYKLYTIIPATLKQLQIDFSLAAFDVYFMLV